MMFIKVLFLTISSVILEAKTQGVTTYKQWPKELTAGKHYNNDTWTFIPNDEGELQLAILSRPQPKRDVNLDTENVKFFLHTSQNQGPYRIRVKDIHDLKNSGYNGFFQTKILIHGFGGTSSNSAIVDLKKAYLTQKNYKVNVIVVDWGVLCQEPWYDVAKQNTPITGQRVGRLVLLLLEHGNTPPENIHIIGFSLGAHVAGYAGASLPKKIRRITGLDAALPLFELEGRNNRLDASDAVCVDTIHTCSGVMGYLYPYGHVDFYPNGGLTPMPGCPIVDAFGACSHPKAVEYFMHSVLEKHKYPAKKCSSMEAATMRLCSVRSTQYMGEDVDCTHNGIFYVNT